MRGETCVYFLESTLTVLKGRGKVREVRQDLGRRNVVFAFTIVGPPCAPLGSTTSLLPLRGVSRAELPSRDPCPAPSPRNPPPSLRSPPPI